MSLRADRLSVSRDGRQLLDNISLELHPGELLAVIGPNGSGKSTLLASLAGDALPHRGRLSLAGRELQAWPLAELARQRAVLHQHNRLEFDFRVDEVVLLGRAARPVADRQRWQQHIVDHCLSATGTRALRGRRWLTLSGGEQRRVQLARVLAQLMPGEDDDPTQTAGRYLLLDEPEASLDIAHRHRVLQLAAQRARDGLGVLAVLHELELALRYADRVAVLDRGRLVCLGSVDEAMDPAVLSAVYGIALSRQRRADGQGWNLSVDA